MVCYLSNDLADYKRPGYILSDGEDNGKVANIKIGDAELQKIHNIKTSGNVLPQSSLALDSVKCLPVTFIQNF